jgi:hypothetical protein
MFIELKESQISREMGDKFNNTGLTSNVNKKMNKEY